MNNFIVITMMMTIATFKTWKGKSKLPLELDFLKLI